jgi:3-hydroxyacyl-CoA dehydrogenase/enoyl-CoA hydratase/3-hydroxybutyryl-CoA epimerase
MSSPYAISTEIDDGVAILTFDMPNESVNKFNRQVKDELIALFDRLEKDPSVKAAVLLSGKKDIWVAGADIEEFLEIRGAADAERLSRDGQQMLDKLESLRVPVVAAIHGACLGGGLEAALACAYRVASDHPKTVLALPEVKLGLIPGAGGTQRLPRLIGLRAALDMILTGKNVRAKQAKRSGLVDEMVHPAILRQIAVRRARELGNGERKRTVHAATGGAVGFLLDSNPIGRRIVLKKAREETLKETRGHYPAPLAAIDAVEAGLTRGLDAGLREEARLFGEMAASSVSKQLIFLFFATTELKKDPGVPEPAPDPLPIRRLGIIGAGFMGAGIASVAAPEGTMVRLKDADSARVAKGLAAARTVLEEKFRKRHITRQVFEDQVALITGTTDYSGFASTDLVIEAVFEDIAVKHQVLREVEQVISDDAIFASNTSTIPITRIAQVAARPDRVVGMHFFSPVHKMPLLEVIVTERTAPQVTATVVAYGKQLGKTTVVVRDGPGFYANRILSPYINEAGKLLDEGASIEAIDAALMEFGFRVGPITLVDEVGIDIAGKAGNIIADAFGSRMAPSQSLQRVVSAGRYGRKGKKGFYLYDKEGKKGGADPTVYDLLPTGRTRSNIPADEIRQRTVLAMVNEAARCLEEGILRSARDGDIAAVFGIGFPPFRGGPFRYVDAMGIADIVAQLEELNGRFPPRFAPADLLVEMARSNLRFYGD